MGQAPVTGPRKLQEIRGLRGGWWRKEAQSTQLWLKSLLKRQLPRASGDRGASRVRGGSRAKGQGGGPDHQRPWNPFRLLWRRRLEGRLQPHPTTDPPLLRAIHGPGAGCRRRKRLGIIGPGEELTLSLVLRKGATSPTGPRFTASLEAVRKTSSQLGCHGVTTTKSRSKVPSFP